MDARRGAWKHNKGTIVIRSQGDGKYRNSEQAHGWTEEYCRYLDYFTKIDISFAALWHQRHRYQTTITLVCNDEDRQAGPMKARKDFKSTTKILASLPHEQGRQNSFIPKIERMRQRPVDEALRAEFEWMSQKLEEFVLATFFLFIIERQDSQWREHQDTQWRDHQWQDRSQVVKRVMWRLQTFAKPMWQSLCKILAHS